ncbi:MAG: ribonuclease J [Eubacteriaceae bacterium]|nr:ribonuclease J [Eubacteriaceae bacterium]
MDQQNKQTNQKRNQPNQPNQRRSNSGQRKKVNKIRWRRPKKSNGKLKVIPIGGLGEVGKNLTVFEYNNEIIIVDCGLKFPDEELYGIDIVLPDFTYLIENASKVKALVVTHGHEDHIGAITYLLDRINVPIFATKLTMGLIKKKLDEKRLTKSTKTHIIKAGAFFKVGNFKIEFIPVNHSIPDAVALFIQTPVANVIHTGDFKVDFQPIDGNIIDLQRLGSAGVQGVDLLLSDSTNVEEKGFTPSESTVGNTFYNLFRGRKNRIIVTSFASNVHRIQQIIDAAVNYNRKVVITGRSMENMVDIAKDLGYLTLPKNVLVNIRDMKRYKDSELVIITTGSQGEPMAALGRMAYGDHRHLIVSKKDTIIISASPVPGNEKMVAEVINKLIELGAEVIYKKFADIHVSGHARQEELKLMLTLVKPKYFLPVHGEERMLVHHANLAESVGMKKEDIFVVKNGAVLELDGKSCKVLKEAVPSQPVLVDGLGVGDIGNIVLNDRKRLSEDGLFIVVLGMRKGKCISGPDVISRGFVYMKESEQLINEAKAEVKKALNTCEKNRVYDWSSIRNEVRDSLSKFLFKKTRRRPMILPILTEI